MSMPSVRAASRTLVPLGTRDRLAVDRQRDGSARRSGRVGGGGSEHGVAHLSHSPPIMLIMPKVGTMSAMRWSVDQLRRASTGARSEGGRHVRLVRAAGAVGDDVEAELAVAALDERVDLAGRHLDAVDDVLEVADHRLDRVVGVALGRQRDARVVDDRPGPSGICSQAWRRMRIDCRISSMRTR